MRNSPNPCIYSEFGVKYETTCSNLIGDYSCDCPPGSTGKNCSDNHDDCEQSGSNNICTSVDKKATCADGLNEYRCTCSAAYKDDLCTTYDACFNVTCSNGGTCSTVDNKFKCTCPVGWEGDKCQTMTNNCKPNPCVYTEYGIKKDATCANKLADYDCNCPSGTTGKNCEENNDDCMWDDTKTTNVCNSVDTAATCSDGLDKFKCTCGPAYKDDQCTTYNACFNVTCLNGATCSTVDMQPVCTCVKGYEGTLCETTYDACVFNHCENGNCSTVGKDFKCSCIKGWEGRHCEIMTDNCSPNPCIYEEWGIKNETTCSNLLADYSCD
uniref:EGF-like domain-containing protein n=1 Tax=Panagrolaimus sp. ES5 TaxID=591445 RepID=A0AC34G9D5_9BILA